MDALRIVCSEEDLTKYFGEGVPGGVLKEFEATKSNSLMVRPKVLQLCNMLEKNVTGKDAFDLPAEYSSRKYLVHFSQIFIRFSLSIEPA